MLKLTPLQLWNGYFTCFDPDLFLEDDIFSYPEVEKLALEDEDEDEDSILRKIREDFKEIKQSIDSLNCTSGAKERLTNKLKEDTYFFLLASRYFNSVAYHFKTRDLFVPLKVPACTTLKEHEAGYRYNAAGIVMKPNEIDEILGEKAFAYSPYLSALLELSEMLVDYTTNIIIKLSTDSDGDDDLVKGQYSLALLNFSLLSHLQNGFQMLDLKNDGIRRKYDKLKYSVKKINGIVYDLSLRRLFPFKAEVTDR